MTTKLEQFAKDVLGIELSPYQVQIARGIIANRPLAKPRAYNSTQTRNVIMRYMRDSVKELE